jgi:hypothetical protein
MKKWKKTILVTGVVSCLIGAVLVGYGTATGGFETLMTTGGSSQSSKFHTKNLDKFDKIVIDSNAYDITIATEKIDKPVISYYTDDKIPVSYEVTDGTLSVSEKSKWMTKRWGINFLTLSDFINLKQYGNISTPRTMIISVPEGTDLDSLKVSLKVGSLTLNDIKTKETDITLATGEFIGDNVKLNNGQLTLQVGNANLQDSSLSNFTTTLNMGSFNLNSGTITDTVSDLSVGSYDANLVTFKKSNTISVDTGDTDINLAAYDLNVKVKSNIGESDITDNLTNSTENTLTITNSIGDITVQ